MQFVISAIAAILLYTAVNVSAGLYYKTDIKNWRNIFFHSKTAAFAAAAGGIAFAAASLIQYGMIGTYDYFRLYIITVFMSFLCITDVKEKKLPNKVLGVLLLIWLAVTSVFIITDFNVTFEKLGTALFGCFFCLLTFGFTYIISKKSLGGGDVKLSLLMGLYLGSERIVAAILYGAVFCALYSIIGLISKKIEKKAEIPFCPFLFAGTIISLFLYV